MKTYAVLSQKGGAGKSTTAIHLAVAAGPGTVLVDCDAQESSRKWSDRRTAPEPGVVGYAAFSANGAVQIARMAANQNTQTLIFDGRPRASDLEAQLAEMADVVIIPSGCSVLDLESVASTFEIVGAIGRPAVCVLTKANARTREYAEAHDWVRSIAPDMPIVTLSNLIIYSRALTSGAAVSEISQAESGAAAAEIALLFKTVKELA